MPNNQTNEDSKLIDRDREVDEILEESKYLLDQEKMELTAQKYRAKQPVAEIFSNADKKPRLENRNPLDVDKEQTVNENEISGDKTATTLQAELVLEGTDDDYPSPQNEILKETEKIRSRIKTKNRRKSKKPLLKKTSQQSKQTPTKNRYGLGKRRRRRNCHPYSRIFRGHNFFSRYFRRCRPVQRQRNSHKKYTYY